MTQARSSPTPHVSLSRRSPSKHLFGHGITLPGVRPSPLTRVSGGWRLAAVAMNFPPHQLAPTNSATPLSFRPSTNEEAHGVSPAMAT